MIDYTQFQPIHDRILVKLLADPQTALIVPEIAQKRSHVGEVIACGPGKRNDKGKLMPMSVRPGDVIRFSLNDLEDGDYTLIRQADVFGFVDGC